jgi:hypothetical protein
VTPVLRAVQTCVVSGTRPENLKRREAALRWLDWSRARERAVLGVGPFPGAVPDLFGYWYVPAAIEDRANGVKLAASSGKLLRELLSQWESLPSDTRESDVGGAVAAIDGEYWKGKASSAWLDRDLEPHLRRVLEGHPDWPNLVAALARWYWKAGSADNVDRLVIEIVDGHGVSALNPIMHEVVTDTANGIGRDLGKRQGPIDPDAYGPILDRVSDLLRPLCTRVTEEWTANWHLTRIAERETDPQRLVGELLRLLDEPAFLPSRALAAKARAHVADLLVTLQDVEGARTQYIKAMITAETTLDASSMAAAVCLRSALTEHDLGHKRHAAVWVRKALRPLILLRDLTADPVIRERLTLRTTVAGELARLAGDVSGLEILHQLLAAIANHGLLNSIDPEPDSGRFRPMSFTPEASKSLTTQRTSFETRWVTTAETFASLSEGEALLQLQMFPSRSGWHITAIYFESSESALAFRTYPRPKEAEALSRLSLQRIAFFRESDWRRLASLLLPDQILSGESSPERLVISASGPLSSFPFGRLPVGRQRLGDLAVISTIPEVGVWSHLPGDVPAGERAVVFGVDATVKAESGLIGLDAEVASLEEAWQTVDSVTSWHELEAALRRPCDLLVLGVHGGIDDDGVHVLGDPTGHWVRSEALADLDLPQTVIASSCWSGVGLGEANPFGLVRPAFIGGARSVVVSLWDLESTSTSRTLQTFYRKLPHARSVAAALCEAQRVTPDVHTGAYWGLAAVSR